MKLVIFDIDNEKNLIIQFPIFVEQILPISLESFEINSSLLQVPKTLKEYINRYQEKRNVHIQEVQNENNNSKFKEFITSFILDVIGFMAAFLTVIIALKIIYVLTGQSKFENFSC